VRGESDLPGETPECQDTLGILSHFYLLLIFDVF